MWIQGRREKSLKSQTFDSYGFWGVGDPTGMIKESEKEKKKQQQQQQQQQKTAHLHRHFTDSVCILAGCVCVQMTSTNNRGFGLNDVN